MSTCFANLSILFFILDFILQNQGAKSADRKKNQKMCKFLKKMLAIMKNIAYKSIEKLMNNARSFVFECFLLGRRQVVRHRLLVPTFVGSNPAAPATVQKSSEMAIFSF